MSAKEKARSLRKQGFGYRTISKRVGVPWPTVRNWVRDIECDSREAYLLSVEEIKRGRFPKKKESIRNRLIEERGRQCEKCKLSYWNEESITLEMHRIDGEEYSRENVLLMCPNCHSQTDNWRRSRNPRGGTGRHVSLRN